jgi:hypothetical protein
MIAACYTLDLYCSRVGVAEELSPNAIKRKLGEHKYNEFPHQYTDEFGATCRADARKHGWKFDMDTGTALCPSCTKAGFKLKDFIQ